MSARYKSVETKYVEARDRTLRALRGLDRRTFFKVSAASAGAAFAKGLAPPHSFQLVEIASAAVDKNWAQTGTQGKPPYRFEVGDAWRERLKNDLSKVPSGGDPDMPFMLQE
jgi:hypothetical protein